MAERKGDTYTDDGTTKTTYVGAEKSAGDVAAANARAKYDPAMRKPDASSLNPLPGGLGAAAARLKAAKAATPRANAVKKLIRDTDKDGDAKGDKDKDGM
jgi:hypothetical protein